MGKSIADIDRARTLSELVSDLGSAANEVPPRLRELAHTKNDLLLVDDLAEAAAAVRRAYARRPQSIESNELTWRAVMQSRRSGSFSKRRSGSGMPS
jgi:hypothetical protein